MKKEIENLTGRKFGRLTVLERGFNDNSRGTKWWCKCECGNKVLVSRHSLVLGLTKSCGCYQKEKSRENGKRNKKYNTYDLSGDFGKGYTSKGEEFWFDKKDYDKIKDYCWYFDKKTGYLFAQLPDTRKRVSLHRLVMGFPKGKMVGHIAHEAFNRYDNRKCNLKIGPMKENARSTNMKNLELQKKAELLEALVNDLCEETSAEETYEHLLTLGTDIGITDEDLKDWGFNLFEDEEDDGENVSEDEDIDYESVADLVLDEGDYERDDNLGEIRIDKQVFDDFVKHSYIKIQFVNDNGDDNVYTYIMESEDDGFITCEFIG